MIELSPILAALLLSIQSQPDTQSAATDAVEPVEETTQVAANGEEEASEDEKIICRRTSVIGSKFKKRVCGTKKQWETLENRSQDTTGQMQRRGKGVEPVGG